MAKHKFASLSLIVRDRAISSKVSTHRVSEHRIGNFKKNFPLPKNGDHFVFSNFCQKMEKHKVAIISLTVRDRAISSKFSNHKVSEKYTLANFQKNFPLTKNVGHFEFTSFCKKMEKHKFATISLTVGERFCRIFRPIGYLRNVLLAIFKKNFPLPKNGGHFEFLPKIP